MKNIKSPNEPSLFLCFFRYCSPVNSPAVNDINVFIPIEDQDGSLDAGPTEFVVGSHRMDEKNAMAATKKNGFLACPVLKQGDVLLYDYRICHRGTSNLTHVVVHEEGMSNGEGRVRNILYLMYARPWFQEHLNFGSDTLFDREDR